jgi:N-acetylneuraminic acid mutarotase
LSAFADGSDCTDLKELSSQELVEQLTLLDQELFDPVSASDFVVWTLQPQERENRAPKLMRFLERFSEIRNWVASTIVGEQEQSDRVDVINKFVAIAEHALDTGSFNLCVAVATGLAHPALNQLSETWAALNKETKATLDQIKSVCDPKDSYAAMWSAMNLWRAPCVPFIGGLLERLDGAHKSKTSDSVFITQSGSQGSDRDLVNFAKLRPLLDSASEIRPLRPTGITFKPKQQIQTLFRKLHALDDDYLTTKASGFKESAVANAPAATTPIWLVPVPPVERKILASSNSLGPQSPTTNESARKQSGAVSSAALKLEKRGSGKRVEKDTPKSPRAGSSTANGIPPLSPRDNVPKLDMTKATSSRTPASISPTAKLRPPSDDESSGPLSAVPKPAVPATIVSPRPTRTGSSTMLLQLQKLEPKPANGTTSKPGTPAAASPRKPSPRAPSPSGSSSPLGSSRESTPPPEIPALPGMAVAPLQTSKASSQKLALPVPVAATTATAASAPAAAPEKEGPASPRVLSPPPTPKEIESMLLESPFETVEAIEEQLSPRGSVSRTESTPAPATPATAMPIQRSASTAISSASPLSPSTSSGQIPRSNSVMPPRTVIPVPADATKEDIRRSQIVAEIKDTEQSYVDFLELLVKDGITPLRKGAILPEADIKSIFSNIETIAGFHRIFLGEINDIVKSWTTDKSEIGSVFEKYHQYFKLYVEFVNNFDKSNTTLQRLLSKNAKLKEIQAALVKKSGKLDFGALLIMPIQRVPRYVLLLKDLRSRTAEDHPDFAHLQKAVKSVKDISLHINSSKKDAELNAKALELKKRLSGFDGELIKPGRRFLRETEASIISSKGSTRVTVLFWNDFVMFCRPSDKRLSYMGSFATGKLQLRTVSPKEMKKKLRPTKEPKDGVRHKFIVSLIFFDVEILLAFKTEQEMQQLLDDHKSAQLEMGARWFKKVSGGEGLPVPDVRDNVGHALVSKLNSSTGVYTNTWYVYGGSHKTVFYDDLWALDFEKAQWTRVDANAKGDKPGPRADHAMVVVGRRLFIWGGHNQGQFSRDVHIYNIDQNTWTCIPALPLGSHNAAPPARAGHSASVAEGRFILIFGGCHFENVSSQKVYNELWLFDTETYQWFPAPGQNAMIPPRTQHSCALLNGDHMVIYGGKGQDNKDLNDMFSYDKNAGVWTTLSKVSGQVPSARSACGVAADDDGSKILLYGGGSVEDTYNDLYIFRARDSSWSLCSLPMDLPKRKSHAMVLVPDTTSTSSLAIFGGRIQNADGVMEYRNDIVIIKDIRKYLYGANADSLKQAKKLKDKCGKLSSYSVLKSGSSARFESISASYNFVHRVHVDQDFRWDMAQNPLEVFQFDELIGRGGFGEVWRAKHKQSQFELAIKKVPASTGNFEKMSKEMEILKGLHHPSIVKYFGFAQVESENWVR